MKKPLVALPFVALTAIAAFTGSAVAADMPMKAPAPVATVTNWTGCYVGAGLGYGMYNDDSYPLHQSRNDASWICTGQH